MASLTTEIVERLADDQRLRARFGEVVVPDDAPVHLVEHGTHQLAVVSVDTEIGPVVLASGASQRWSVSDWFAEVEHVATLASGAELWAVVGATDLLTWARDQTYPPARRRRVGQALLQLGETLLREGVRHGAVEGATVVVSTDGEPLLLPWTGDRADDRMRLQALGVAVIASAVDRTLGHSFGPVGLLRPTDLGAVGEGPRWAALAALSEDRRAPPDLRFVLRRALDSLERVCGDVGASSVLDADVRFSAFHPSATPRHDWARLLVLAHHGGRATTNAGEVVDLEELVADAAAQHFGPDADVERSSSAHAVPIERGDQLTFTVHCAGGEVDAPCQTVSWTGPIEEVVFWLHPDTAASAIEGAVEVYIGAFVRARIPFSIPVGTGEAPSTTRTTVDAYRDVFVSYAHEDRPVVDALSRLNTLGDRFLIDAQELRVGQDWRARLGELIRQAEVFQLFWSDASSRSAEVEVEWRQALDLREPAEFIRPIYWQHPMPPVPEPLGGLHFDYVPLGGGGAPILAATARPVPVPDVAQAPPPPAPQPVPERAAPRRDSSWLQAFTRVAMVLVALFGFGAVYAGQVIERSDTEIGEGPFVPPETGTDSSTPATDATLPPTAGSTVPPATSEPDSPPDTVPPTTVPDTAPSTSSPPPPPSSVPATSIPPTSDVTNPPTSVLPTSTTEPSPLEPTLSASLAGPVLGTIDRSRYPVELVVTNGPLTIDAITAMGRDGAEVTVIAPQVPLTVQTGTTVVDVDLAAAAGSVDSITLVTRLGRVSVSGLP